MQTHKKIEMISESHLIVEALILRNSSHLSSPDSQTVFGISRRNHTLQAVVPVITRREQHKKVLVLMEVLVHIHG